MKSGDNNSRRGDNRSKEKTQAVEYSQGLPFRFAKHLEILSCARLAQTGWKHVEAVLSSLLVKKQILLTFFGLRLRHGWHFRYSESKK